MSLFYCSTLTLKYTHTYTHGFPGSSAGKESACNAGNLRLIPELGRSPGEGNGYPLQCSGLENSMSCAVNGVVKCRTRLSLSDFHTHTHTHTHTHNLVGLGLSCGMRFLLWCKDSLVVVRGLSCSTAHGILGPWPGIKPTSFALQSGILTTGPPGNSHSTLLSVWFAWIWPLQLFQEQHISHKFSKYLCAWKCFYLVLMLDYVI